MQTVSSQGVRQGSPRAIVSPVFNSIGVRSARRRVSVTRYYFRCRGDTVHHLPLKQLYASTRSYKPQSMPELGIQ